MSQLQIFWNLGSQPGRAVKALIDVGKIAATFTSVDTMQREQRSKQYLEMYSAGKIPVLKKGDFTLGESGAIMIYLCETNPHLMPYYGTTIEARAKVNQYLSWYQSYFRLALFKPIRLYLGAAMFNTVISEQHKQSLDEDMFDAIKQFNHLLGNNQTKYVAGDQITFVDFLFYFEMTNLVYFGKNHDQYPHIKRWFAEVYRLPEVKAITHEWFGLAKGMAQLFSGVQIEKKSKL